MNKLIEEIGSGTLDEARQKIKDYLETNNIDYDNLGRTLNDLVLNVDEHLDDRIRDILLHEDLYKYLGEDQFKIAASDLEGVKDFIEKIPSMLTSSSNNIQVNTPTPEFEEPTFVPETNIQDTMVASKLDQIEPNIEQRISANQSTTEPNKTDNIQDPVFNTSKNLRDEVEEIRNERKTNLREKNKAAEEPVITPSKEGYDPSYTDTNAQRRENRAERIRESKEAREALEANKALRDAAKAAAQAAPAEQPKQYASSAAVAIDRYFSNKQDKRHQKTERKKNKWDNKRERKISKYENKADKYQSKMDNRAQIKMNKADNKTERVKLRKENRTQRLANGRNHVTERLNMEAEERMHYVNLKHDKFGAKLDARKTRSDAIATKAAVKHGNRTEQLAIKKGNFTERLNIKESNKTARMEIKAGNKADLRENNTERLRIKEENKTERYTAREEGKTDRYEAKQEGMTERYEAKQEGMTERREAREETNQTQHESDMVYKTGLVTAIGVESALAHSANISSNKTSSEVSTTEIDSPTRTENLETNTVSSETISNKNDKLAQSIYNEIEKSVTANHGSSLDVEVAKSLTESTGIHQLIDYDAAIELQNKQLESITGKPNTQVYSDGLTQDWSSIGLSTQSDMALNSLATTLNNDAVNWNNSVSSNTVTSNNFGYTSLDSLKDMVELNNVSTANEEIQSIANDFEEQKSKGLSFEDSSKKMFGTGYKAELEKLNSIASNENVKGSLGDTAKNFLENFQEKFKELVESIGNATRKNNVR